ncbi:cohesin subunit SA-2 isoform X2 [Notolabrus celidotus]|uniref:cohesin subunit SA-2 isoform X2 n=1 Tax=Notolabrus celidotus TaxID=1203425 RepID=UPI00149065DA|nr:cohesin subunit SA-2 isoform X2 [Notolabrus celidotus]
MIPEPSAAAASASRSSEQNNDGANSSGAVNHSEDDSGNENRQKSVRRRKRTHKPSENVKSKSAKASRSSVSRARGRKQKHVEAVTLFEVITMGRSAMQAVIDDWIEAYVTDRDSSLLDLISFFIQCCGCKGVVTAEMCQNKEDSDVMSKMVEELDEVAGLQYKKFLAFPWILTVTWPMDTDSMEYPLTQSGPYRRWFHSEFCDFVSVLVTQCQHSVIFDCYLMNTVISLLTELSNSYVRAFRHTCTLAAVKLLSSLVGVALSLSVGIENSQKLSEVQKTKTMRQKSTLQLERIQKKITELREKRTEIESMMDIIFKGIFLKRYRDVLPEIRSICMEELGLWMKLYSSSFLNDSYLKYMGWMMHDKVPDVRLKCVLSLQGLYGDPVLLPKLDLFTSRFKDRMISMTLDKDNEVAVQTMKLLVLISKNSDDVLSLEDYKQLLQFVYSSQRPLAATAGELLYSRLLNTASPASETQDDPNEEEEEHKQQTFTRLKALLRFFQESQLHKHVVYLVDSLWDCGGALLKDWPALTSVLLQDPPSESQGLTQDENAVLVEILVASVRQTSEGPVLAGRSGAKKVMSAREKKIQVDECTKLTEHLIVVLPKLLSKFSDSPDIVASLIKIPQFFIPECAEAGNTQVVSDLLAEIGAVLDLHSSPAVLEAAARTYLSLCGEEMTCCSEAQTARDSLIQSWVDKLTSLLQSTLKEDRLSADEGETREITVTLKKLRAFYNCHDLSGWTLFELLSPLLSVEGGQGGPTPEVLLEVLQCLSFSMVWSLNTSDTLTSKEKAVAQRLQLRLFCERGHHCLSHSDLCVRQQAFLGVCDVLTAHSYQLHVWDPTSFGPLLYTPSPKLQRALLTFVCQHVFVGAESDSHSGVSENSEEERLEDLHRQRNLLAAYCKLIIHGVLEMSMAAEVFMYYMKYYNDFGDIIKETMYRTRQVDKIESSRTLVLCLQQLFVRLKREQESGSGRAHPGVQTFTSIKELARRFALTFGDLVKFRECVVMIHRNGIEFVFQEFSQGPETPTPLYLSYLTILSEFSSKLLKPDKKTVFSYLQKHTTEHVIDLREECWQPLIYYRASLLAAAEGEDAASYVSSDRRPNRSPLSKQKLEGNKSPCLLTPADSKVSKGHRSSFSPSRQEKTTDMDPFSVPVDPPARMLNLGGSVVSASNDAEDDTVEVEL